VNDALLSAVRNGHVDVVDCLLRHAMFDPSADDNCAIKLAAECGHVAVVERLLQDERVNPSAGDNYAFRFAAQIRTATSRSSNDYCKTSASIRRPAPTTPCDGLVTRNGYLAVVEHEICIALQAMELPAWVTVQILDAARPWSTLPLHSKWNLVCAVKHFHDKHPDPAQERD
jgi:hypothetical protein